MHCAVLCLCSLGAEIEIPISWDKIQISWDRNTSISSDRNTNRLRINNKLGYKYKTRISWVGDQTLGCLQGSTWPLHIFSSYLTFVTDATASVSIKEFCKKITNIRWASAAQLVLVAKIQETICNNLERFWCSVASKCLPNGCDVGWTC